MTACTQPGCTGTIVDNYCDVCGSPAGAPPFIPAGEAAPAESAAPADRPGLTAGRQRPGVPPAPRNGRLMTACMQPGCTGTIVDDYCDVCGSPTGAPPFIPAGAAARQPDPAEEERPTQPIPRAQMTKQPSSTQLTAVPAAADPGAPGVENVDEEKVDPAVARQELSRKTEAAPTGPDDADTVTPRVRAVLNGGRHPRPQLVEQQVLAPLPVQNPEPKKHFGSLALAAAILAALLIGGLLFANRDVGGVTKQSVTTVTATATATVNKSPTERSDESTDTVRGESPIQLEDLAASARPFEAVRIQGTYRGGANTFLRVQRWEEGKWLDFPLPTKTDQSGRFITQAEFGQPGRYRLRVLDLDSGVASKPFVVVIKG
jgi:hypothetical protein